MRKISNADGLVALKISEIEKIKEEAYAKGYAKGISENLKKEEKKTVKKSKATLTVDEEKKEFRSTVEEKSE